MSAQESNESTAKSMCQCLCCDLGEVESACGEGAFSSLCVQVVNDSLVSSLNNILLLFPAAMYMNYNQYVCTSGQALGNKELHLQRGRQNSP